MTQACVCHVCGESLEELAGYPVGGQVSSDCRPWQGSANLACCAACGVVQKPVTAAWQAEMQRLYAGYAVYQQGEGVEQVSFDQAAGTATARSLSIVQWLQARSALASTGDLLDVGCGNGAFLRAFGQAHPGWRMAGLELDDRNRKAIENIAGVTKLHVGAVDGLADHFDLVAMVHALEHMPDPVAYLRRVAARLRPGRLLLIEVPDLLSSPFDILIADHCSHFTADSLRHLLERAGFSLLHLQAGHVAKELTALARLAAEELPLAAANAAASKAAAAAHIHWLQAVLGQAQAQPAPLGIFGTSISATWLAAALPGTAACFVDEDSNRVGRQHMGLPVHGPQDAPPGLRLLMPLRTDIALAVSRRLAHTGLQFIIPPLA